MIMGISIGLVNDDTLGIYEILTKKSRNKPGYLKVYIGGYMLHYNKKF